MSEHQETQDQGPAEHKFGWVADNAAVITPAVLAAGQLVTEAVKAKIAERKEAKAPKSSE